MLRFHGLVRQSFSPLRFRSRFDQHVLKYYVASKSPPPPLYPRSYSIWFPRMRSYDVKHGLEGKNNVFFRCYPSHQFTKPDPRWTLRYASTTTQTSSSSQKMALSHEKSLSAEETNQVKNPTQWKRLLEMVWPEKKPILGSMGLLLISSGITVSVPMCMGKLIDYATGVSGFEAVPMSTVAAGLSSIFVVGAAANFCRIGLMNEAGERIIARLRERVFGSILWQDAEFFAKNRTGELINRLSADSQMVGRVLTDNVAQGMRNVAQAVGSMGVMALISPKLSLVVLSIVPPTTLAAVLYGRYVKKLQKNVQTALAETTTLAEERFANIRLVKSFTNEMFEFHQYSDKVQKVFQLAKRQAWLSGGMFGFAGLIGNLSTVGVLAYGGTLVSAGQLTVGELTSFLFYTIYAAMSTVGLSNVYGEYMKGVGASTRLFEIMDTPRHIEAAPLSENSRIPPLRGAITFDQVHFAYPDRMDVPVLKNLSLDVPAGEVIALVGGSGAGKTTVATLLNRFFDPQQGIVQVDGQDIREMDASSLRAQIAYVNQQPTLFAGTVRDNIGYGSGNAQLSQEDIEHAAKQANAHDFIMRFPQGYDTQVGERGHSVSGGEAQRIALARALAKDAPILILDETTSQVDSHTEKEIQAALDRLMVNRTVIVIAHRLSTLRKANRIAVIQDGSVAEIGSRDELMNKKDGLFKKLAEKQLLV